MVRRTVRGIVIKGEQIDIDLSSSGQHVEKARRVSNEVRCSIQSRKKGGLGIGNLVARDISLLGMALEISIK